MDHRGLLGLSSAWLLLVVITNITTTLIMARNIAAYTDQLSKVWKVVYRCFSFFKILNLLFLKDRMVSSNDA